MLGPHGIGNMNDNGQRLLKLCSEFSLRIMTTYFQENECSKVTWQQPRAKLWHQQDHVLYRKSDHNSIPHVRSIRSADCNSDHILVRCKLALPLKKHHTARVKPKPHLNICALKGAEPVTNYQTALAEKLSDFPSSPQNFTEACDIFSKSVIASAKESLGFQRRRQPDWFEASSDIISPVLSEKRRLRNLYLANPSQSNADRFKEIKIKAERVSCGCIERYWNVLSSRIQHC